MSILRLNLVQARLQWSDPASNRAHLETLMRDSAASDLHVLPEAFTTGFLGERRDQDEDMSGETVAWLQSTAVSLDAAICGSAVISDPVGRRNRWLFAAPDGQLEHYDKRHLFSFAGEDKRYVAGNERVVFEYNGWRICPQICYDLRFPVWCRSRDDYDLMIFVANWPSPRIAAWDTLLRARAIENQCFVIGVNRVGEDGRGTPYPGHSACYGPLGETVIEPWGEEGSCQATIDLERVRGIRKDFPFAAEADDFSLR